MSVVQFELLIVKVRAESFYWKGSLLLSRIVCYGRFGVGYDRSVRVYDWFDGGYDRSAEVYGRLTQPERIELHPAPTNSASYLSS